MNIENRLQLAVQSFWDGRASNLANQKERGTIDAGTRGAVTAGTQMGGLEVLIADILCDAGLKELDVKACTGLELPGYYRPEKRWDLIVVSEGQLVLAMEFKSMVGSFGKNANNRFEEAVGNAKDISGQHFVKVDLVTRRHRSLDILSCSKTTQRSMRRGAMPSRTLWSIQFSRLAKDEADEARRVSPTVSASRSSVVGWFWSDFTPQHAWCSRRMRIQRESRSRQTT